jgi:two-component system, chemotaxis family, chemotaxis protein CheY
MKVMLKVLVVDDSTTMRKVLIKELLKLNFSESNLVEASDGREAIRATMEKKFDLIIMDWNMPNILGIEAVKSIRGAGIETPILMVTTESEKDNIIAAIRAGANNYLVKPFSSESFRNKIVDLMSEALDEIFEIPISARFDEVSNETYDDSGVIYNTAPPTSADDNEGEATRIDFDKGAILSDFDKRNTISILSFTTVMPPMDALRWLAHSDLMKDSFDLYHFAESKGYIIFSDPGSDQTWGVLYPVYVSRRNEKLTIVEVAIRQKFDNETAYTEELQKKHQRCYQNVKSVIFKEAWQDSKLS